MRTKSAKKALRQSKKREVRNKKIRKALKEAIKVFRKNPIKKDLSKLYSLIDTAAKKRVIHKNKAARLKSRLAKLLNKKERGSQELPRRKTVKKRLSNKKASDKNNDNKDNKNNEK